MGNSLPPKIFYYIKCLLGAALPNTKLKYQSSPISVGQNEKKKYPAKIIHTCNLCSGSAPRTFTGVQCSEAEGTALPVGHSQWGWSSADEPEAPEQHTRTVYNETQEELLCVVSVRCEAWKCQLVLCLLYELCFKSVNPTRCRKVCTTHCSFAEEQ